MRISAFNKRLNFIVVRLFLLLFAITLFASCDTDEIELSETDYLVFGHFYGMCAGENCIDIYRLESDRLLKDTTDVYPSYQKKYVGKYIQLTDNKYQELKDLTDFFPSDLLAEKDTIIGMPDYADGGGLYVEYHYKGVHKYWLIDQMKSNVPKKYHAFIDKINEKISFLQDAEKE